MALVSALQWISFDGEGFHEEGFTSKSSAVRFSRQIRHMGCVPLALRFIGLPGRPLLELRRPKRLSRWVAALAESGLPPLGLPEPIVASWKHTTPDVDHHALPA